MLNVGELAKRCKVSAETVRYYARIDLLHPDHHPMNGYKLFDGKDIKRLHFIRQAKMLGFSLTEIKDILNHASQGESPCPLVRSLIQEKSRSNRQKLKEMNMLQQRMDAAIAQWCAMQDGEPNGDSICRLIESFSADA